MKDKAKLIAEWKAKYGNVYQIETENGLTGYLFDPMSKLVIVKALMAALMKGTFEFVETLVNNCWIDGDAEIKNNDKIKAGLWEQVKDIIDIPDHEVEFKDGHAVITVEGKSITVRMATRQEIKYAEDRNKGDKPLDTQIYLLEKLANKDELNEWRINNRLYVGLLTAVDKVKERIHVSVKKL
jgi:hypothetical protein